MFPRAFNQDPIENFFGQLRQRGARNVNPTTVHFSHYYRNILIGTFTSTHSLGANCEDDHSEMLISLKRFVTQVSYDSLF